MKGARFRLSFIAAVAAFLCVSALAPAQAHADTASYRQAVSDAYNLVSKASAGDVAVAQQAAAVLQQGTGPTQPEILADLSARPPAFTDATARLRALLDMLDGPASTSDPQQAKTRLHNVLAMSRYDALHRPPSAFDRLGQWIQDRIRDLLRFLFGSPGGVGGIVPVWVIYAIGVLMIAAVAIVVFRSTRGRLAGGFAGPGPSGPRAPADYFAEADRLAAKGDRVGAIRALCAGVAGTLAGERTWDGSPLTVREIFQRAPDPARLWPLLQPFEAAVYGGREVDPAAYEKAAVVAAPFRAPVERAA